jgi:hypothetical protein
MGAAANDWDRGRLSAPIHALDKLDLVAEPELQALESA